MYLTDNDYPELLQKNKQSRILHVDLDPSYHDFQGAWKNHSQLSLNDLLKQNTYFKTREMAFDISVASDQLYAL